MRLIRGTVIVIAHALLGTTLAAQAASDGWAPFLGDWRGPGVAMGQPATGDSQWARVLNGRFVRLQMSFTPTGASAPVFAGHAYYSTADSTGLWVDSQGARYNLVHHMLGDTLVVRYTMSNGAAAESRYVRDSVGRLIERSLVQRRDGTWNEFLSYRFERQVAAAR
jgi:hypothetical protein